MGAPALAQDHMVSWRCSPGHQALQNHHQGPHRLPYIVAWHRAPGYVVIALDLWSSASRGPVFALAPGVNKVACEHGIVTHVLPFAPGGFLRCSRWQGHGLGLHRSLAASMFNSMQQLGPQGFISPADYQCML